VRMANKGRYFRSPSQFVAALLLLSVCAATQVKKESRFETGPAPVVSITNNCGSITVEASANNQVLVTTMSYSDQVRFMNQQHGNRIDLRAECKPQRARLADYLVLTPKASVVVLESLDGRLNAKGLGGDVILEGSTAFAEVSEAADAHIHIKTSSGPITVTDIRHSRLDLHSLSGNISLHDVADSFVEGHSGSGRITYDGDPGSAGDFKLTSHTGDLDISIPATARVEIKAHSLKDLSNQPANVDEVPGASQKSLFMKPGVIGASRFVLRSFRGKVHLKRP
jgi:hypothetical protein